jgi:hypothetical protein
MPDLTRKKQRYFQHQYDQRFISSWQLCLLQAVGHVSILLMISFVAESAYDHQVAA